MLWFGECGLASLQPDVLPAAYYDWLLLPAAGGDSAFTSIMSSDHELVLQTAPCARACVHMCVYLDDFATVIMCCRVCVR